MTSGGERADASWKRPYLSEGWAAEIRPRKPSRRARLRGLSAEGTEGLPGAAVSCSTLHPCESSGHSTVHIRNRPPSARAHVGNAADSQGTGPGFGHRRGGLLHLAGRRLPPKAPQGPASRADRLREPAAGMVAAEGRRLRVVCEPHSSKTRCRRQNHDSWLAGLPAELFSPRDGRVPHRFAPRLFVRWKRRRPDGVGMAASARPSPGTGTGRDS